MRLPSTIELIITGLSLAAFSACGDDATPPGDGGGTDSAVADTGADDSGPGGDVGPADGGGPAPEWAALVRGTLFTTDLDEAQARHDPLASGGRASAMAAGDFAHDVLLGTTLLGTTENQFVAVDRWTNLEGMTAFYTDPDFAAAFGMLFAEAPALETFERAHDFHQWGDLDAADAAAPHYFVVVRGTLAMDDRAMNQSSHDAVAMAGEAMAVAAGDVAHVVYLGVGDEREFLAIDVWGDSTNIEALYGDPDFIAAFGSLFSEAPTLGVYASTDWEQW